MEKFELFWRRTLLLFLPWFVLSACAQSTSPSGPESASGVYVGAGFEFYRWKEGTALMIWHDAIQSSSCASTTNEQVFAMDCHALTKDNSRFDWSLETKDGETVDYFLNDQEFNLTDGELFVITASGGRTNSRQLRRDLSKVQPNAEQVIDFGLAEPAVQDLIQITSSIQDCISSSIVPKETLGTDEVHAAQQALTSFFSHLHAGEYEQAADLYSGSYSVMQDHNPNIDPDDHAALLRNACTINGAQCLEIRKTTLIEVGSYAEFQFAVEFVNHDGSIFILGSCCGSGDSNSDHHKEFIYTVRKECTGEFKVIDPPIYLP